MHLRAVKLRGFKSFPDPVEIRLEPGVGVIVGPNGSGKSNVSDAIRWAAGSLSPTELRAEKPDDVLFAGGGSRGAADFCEVELLFDNADGALPVDYAELSVARRLHRGGEGQYLVNRAAVRRLDLVELLADLGLGQGMHSIISQGKVEAILASRPAERRALIEEAAGLGRFKARRHRAELKLARVALEVERARDVEAEVRKRLRPLALQATAAERAQKLAVEIARLRARIAQLDLAGLEERLAELETRRTAARSVGGAGWRSGSRRCSPSGRRAEEELARRGGRDASRRCRLLYRLRSAAERLALRRESVEALRCSGCATSSPRPRRVARRARPRRARGARRASCSCWRSDCARSTGRSPSAKGCRRRRARWRRKASGSPSRCSRSSRAASEPLPRRWDVRPRPSSATIRPEPSRCSSGRAPSGLGSLVVLVGRTRRDLVSEMPVVSKEELLASPVAAVTLEGFGYDPGGGELWFAGETAEALLLELQARRTRARGRGSTSCGAVSTPRSPRPPTRSSGTPWPTAASQLAERLVARARRLGGAPRGAAPRGRRHRRHPQRRARRRAAQARRGRGRAAAGARGRVRSRLRRSRSRPRGSRRRGRRGAPPPRAGECRRAGRGRRPRAARRDGRAPRAPPRDARPGQPARAGGVRGREGAARGARRAAGRPRGEPRGAREAPQRADRDGRAPLHRDLRRRPAATSRTSRGPSSPAAKAACGSPRPRTTRTSEEPGRRGRAAPGRKAGAAALAPLRRREGARRDRLPLRTLPRAAMPVLPPRRGRGRARRHEHRPLRRAAAPLLRPRAVRRDHAPEADDGGRRRPLRRDDGRRGRLPGRLPPPPARGSGSAPAQPRLPSCSTTRLRSSR